MALHAEGEAGTEAADVTSTRMGGNPGGGLHLEHHDGQAGPLPKGMGDLVPSPDPVIAAIGWHPRWLFCMANCTQPMIG